MLDQMGTEGGALFERQAEHEMCQDGVSCQLLVLIIHLHHTRLGITLVTKSNSPCFDFILCMSWNAKKNAPWNAHSASLMRSRWSRMDCDMDLIYCY